MRMSGCFQGERIIFPIQMGPLYGKDFVSLRLSAGNVSLSCHVELFICKDMKGRLVFCAFWLVLLAIPGVNATKLVEVKVVDKDYLMLFFKDGEVFYRDDGKGPSACRGHAWAEGDDTLKTYGRELDVQLAALASSWSVVSPDDSYYEAPGRQPLAVYRKSKVMNTDAKFNYKLDHWIYLKLPSSMKEGSTYVVRLNPALGADKAEAEIVFDVTRCMSEAVHVNIIGYTPESAVKAADLYLWMGNGGQRDYSSFEGNKVWLYNVATGRKQRVGKVNFWKTCQTHTEALGRNLTGSDVWNIDFTSKVAPGRYRLVVEGVGCSMDFDIDEEVYFEPYKTQVRGYYYMRLGEDRPDMTPIPRRPLFIPETDPKGFTIYLTDLQPWHPEWKQYQGDIWDEPHFKPALQSMFWRHRLPGNPVNTVARGGHSDAFDWDRHLAHVSNIYDMLLPYFLTGGKLDDDDLQIGESGNGIPDVMDEARNEVDFWLSLRDGEAYCHGLTNPSAEHTVMFQAGATTMAAWANAANCAMMADCFRISGHKELEAYYADEAVKAFDFASRQPDLQLDDKQDIGDCVMSGRDFKHMAAAFLYNVTGDKKWEDIMAAECLKEDGKPLVLDARRGCQIWGTAAYLNTPRPRHYPELYAALKAAVAEQARQKHVVHIDERPSRRSSDNNYWQTAQNLHLVILAHFVAGKDSEKKLLEKTMLLEADWGLGRNPSNRVEMTGLGQRCVENCYTTGRNDGTPGLHPGHTPYNNLDTWNKSNGSDPQWFVEKGYPEWKTGGWPHQEAYFNCRYVWANGEFTPRQTMRGKMALYGYLLGMQRKH